MPGRNEVPKRVFGMAENGALLHPRQLFFREALYLQQLFPSREVPVAIAMIHDVISDVFGDTGELRQLFDACGIQINGVHDCLEDASGRSVGSGI